MKAAIKRRRSMTGFIVGGVSAAGIPRLSSAASAPGGLAKPWSDIVHRLNDWHAIVMVLCLVIIVAVFGALLYSILARRNSAEAASGNFHKRTAVEVIWAILPFVIVIGMALPTARSIMDGPAQVAPGEHAVTATPERSVQCASNMPSTAHAQPGCP